MNDGRLKDQSMRMKKHFSKCIIIVEGRKSSIEKDEYEIMKQKIIELERDGFEFHYTPNKSETWWKVADIARQYYEYLTTKDPQTNKYIHFKKALQWKDDNVYEYSVFCDDLNKQYCNLKDTLSQISMDQTTFNTIISQYKSLSQLYNAFDRCNNPECLLTPIIHDETLSKQIYIEVTKLRKTRAKSIYNDEDIDLNNFELSHWLV